MTVRQLLDDVSTRFQRAGLHPARREAEWLLSHVTGRDRLNMMVHPETEVSPEEEARYEALVRRRLAREPLQYLTGEAGFHGRLFHVTPAVLIPRPETEMLVDWILESGMGGRGAGVLDLGTGSGCIPISVHLSSGGWACTGVDISDDALDVARGNADRMGAIVEWVSADMRAPGLTGTWNEPFGIVVSNPPYIDPGEKETMQPEVRNHEPHLALFTSDDPLEFYRSLVEVAPALLIPGGALVMEVHAERGTDVLALLDPEIWTGATLHHDLSGRERMVTALFRG